MTRDEGREVALAQGWTVYEDVVDLVMAVAAFEREACAEACEAVHIRPIQGAHEEYMDGKEMAIMQCARAIRMRSNVKVTGAPAHGD